MALPWESIKFVTSGLTLLAFVVVAGLYAWRSRIGRDKVALSRVPEAEMAGLIKSLNSKYDLPTMNLPPAEVSSFIKDELASKERLAKYRLNLWAFCAVLFTILAGISIWQAIVTDAHISDEGNGITNASLPEGLTWKRAVETFCDHEKLTPQFADGCKEMLGLKVKAGQISYARIEDLVNLLALRIIEDSTQHEVKAILLKDQGILQINCP